MVSVDEMIYSRYAARREAAVIKKILRRVADASREIPRESRWHLQFSE